MIYVLSIVMLLMSILMAYLLFERRKTKRDLIYIITKLNQIVDDDSDQQIKVFTSNKELMDLLVALNRILASNLQTKAEKHRQDVSMKKMLSNVSHDLKTPLTIIKGYIETLMINDSLSIDKRYDLLKRTEEKAERMNQLIAQFFDLSRLESDDILLELEQVDINEVCRQALLSYYELLEKKNIEVNLRCSEKPLYMMSNKDYLNRILDNLISNAVKYGYMGNQLGLSVSKENDAIYIKVWDSGKGIEEKYYNAVFERLYTLEDSRNSDYQGSGLGLTITKRLVEKLNGQITLTSEPYVKTEFTIKFQL